MVVLKLKQLIIILSILASSCMNKSIHYEYADGSANLYLLSETELRYLPVTAGQSSTGSYSGGEPQTLSVTSAQFNELKELFDQALENTSIHLPERIKTSGMISVMGSSKKQCIIPPNCAEMKAIEMKLKELMAK